MELKRLRYFVVTAEELHMGRAAERLGIAQPALSQQMKVLERALGVRLFTRIGRGIQLTPVGAAFLPEARATVVQAERAAEVAHGAARGELGRIEIGYVESALLEPPLPRLIGDFRRRHPAVDLRLSKLPALAQMDALRDHRLDIAFVRGLDADLGRPLRARTFSRTGLVLALPASHPAAANPAVALADLAGERFLVLQDADLPGFFFGKTTALCRTAGFEPAIDLRIGEMTSLVGLVAAGLGVALLPASITNFARDDVAFRPLTGTAERIDLLLVQRRDDPPAPVRNFTAMAFPDGPA